MNRREFAKAAGLAIAGLASGNNACLPERRLYLAIDDAPEKNTAAILDTLAKAKAKATFFIIGKAAGQDPNVVRRAIHEGHAIGNHSYTHPNFRAISYDEGIRQIMLTDHLIDTLLREQGSSIEQQGRFFRYPKDLHTNRLHYEFLPRIGYTVCRTSLDSKDWNDELSPEELIAQSKRADDGDVVACHEYDVTLERIIPAMLEHYLPRGFKFETMQKRYPKA